ncbi:hypothetical protein RSAG8_00154, partial [Rhizoctonia solani AG-8 WAC10335]
MVSGWQSGDWILGATQETTQNSRLTNSASPQSERGSNAAAVQEPDIRPPAGGQPPPQFPPNQGFPQRYTSPPTSPLGQNTGHKDTRTFTDPITHDRFLLFPPATLAEQTSLPKLPLGNTADSASDLSSRHPAQFTIYRPISLDTSSQQNASSPPAQLAQALWDNDPVKPGAVLFSTGPAMSKPPSSQPPSTDPARHSSVDRALWAAPSGVPSSNPSSDPASTQDRDVVHSPVYQPDAPSLVYTMGHSTNAGPHTGYAVGYPSYPGSTPFGPSSPRHPSFGGPPNTSPHVQGGTYPNVGSGPVYPNYRPGVPYSPYTPYQTGSGFNQYPTSPPAFGPMPGNFAVSPAASGYPTSPSTSNYQGSSVGGGYPSPTGAYGMHFAPYGMVSAPPMYAPATYAHAPYGHPYLPPQGHADEGPTSGMWWFMPAGASPGANATQSAGTYGTQPQTQTQASAASKAGLGGSRVTSPTTRKPWHPNPPVARSDWVMWAGNVPSDATNDELWSFFNQDTTAREPVAPTGPGRTLLPPSAPADKDTGAGANTEHSHGVSSVFLISRSNCAFVNYDEEVYLNRAVSFFNGRPLRPQDPRCPRLVCRVRRKDDDLRAGVGGQRGLGMHARWVQEQERMGEGATSGTDAGKDQDTVDDAAASPSTYLGAASSSGSSPPVPAPANDVHKLPADLLGSPHAGDLKDSSGPHHSGSGSTNSSFLARNFPKRYFILKSLTQFDLNISVDRGLWATQAHNESTLDRAYRTSKDVYLIFSANKSGEWFGYARMEGPITNSRQSVSWESRGASKSPTSPTVPRKSEAAAGASSDATEAGQPGSKSAFFSPSEHKFAASPAPITPGFASPAAARIDGPTSAPPEMDQAHKPLT